MRERIKKPYIYVYTSYICTYKRCESYIQELVSHMVHLWIATSMTHVKLLLDTVDVTSDK